MNKAFLSLLAIHLLVISMTTPVQAECSLCPGGGAMAFPYQTIPGTTLTCLEYQDQIQQEMSNDDCEVTAMGRMMPNKESLDIASYCGCQCAICDDGSDMTLSDRVINLGDLNSKTSCSAVQNLLRMLTPMDCKLFYETTPINISAFCGCRTKRSQQQHSQPQLPPSQCSLCGDEFTLRNENKVIPDTGGLTCGTVYDLSFYVIDDAFCQDRIQILRGVCCGLKPPTSAPGTSTRAPTFSLPKYELVDSTAVRPRYMTFSSIMVALVLAVGGSYW